QQARGMFSSDQPRLTTLEELVERFGITGEGAVDVLTTAVRLGLLREAPDGRVEEVAPVLLEAGEAAMRTFGLDVLEALELLGRLRKHADGVARIYVDLFVTRIWQPFVDAGKPEH